MIWTTVYEMILLSPAYKRYMICGEELNTQVQRHTFVKEFYSSTDFFGTEKALLMDEYCLLVFVWPVECIVYVLNAYFSI